MANLQQQLAEHLPGPAMKPKEIPCVSHVQLPWAFEVRGSGTVCVPTFMLIPNPG